MGTGENSLPGLQRLGLMNELRGFCCAAPTAAAACPDEQDGHSPALLLSSLLSSSEGVFSFFLQELWCPSTPGKWHFLFL